MNKSTSKINNKFSNNLSVIIPSYNSNYLDQAIKSAKQFNPLEIIIIDTSPYKPEINGVTLHHQNERLNAAAARNKGANLAKGDLLLFMDSDIILKKENKSIIERQINNKENNIICGIYEKTPGENKISSFQRGILTRRLGGHNNSLPKIFSSSHFLIGKNSFIKSGGFNETLDYYEDVEFFLRCKVFGLNVEVNKCFLAIHLKEFNLKSLIKDYFFKTNAAIKIRQNIPKLFKGNSGDIPLGMHLSGGVGLITILLSFFFISSKSISFGYISTSSSLFSIFVLSLFSCLAYPRSALKVSRILSASLWTVCYGTILIALTLSIIKISFFKIIDFIIELSDFFRNGLRVVFKNGRPVQIINYVTSRCNLRCSHCFYKESLNNPNPGEIPRKNLIKTMKDIGPVLWYSLAGGEPFIRNDLEEIIGDVHYYCRPKVFSFPTNGWYTERTFNSVLRSLQRLKRGNIILFFSLDGPENIHDEIRGKGSFEKLSNTIERLRPLKRIYKNLYINFILTVTPQNAKVAPEFIKKVSRNFSADAISINLIREHRPNAPSLPSYLIDAYEDTITAYADEVTKGKVGGYKFLGSKFLRAKEFLQKQMILKVARNNEFVTPCTAGTLSYVIMEDGSIKPCEILSDKIGNVYDKNKSFLDIVSSHETKNLRKFIKDTQCKCTYECAMSTNTLFSLPMVPKLISRTLFPDWLTEKLK